MSVRYLIRLPDPAAARGKDPALSFTANGFAAFAEQLQEALRSTGLFERWRQTQPDPDAVDPALGATDPQAQVEGRREDMSVYLTAVTSLPGEIVRHRLRLLAGSHWELRDVRG